MGANETKTKTRRFKFHPTKGSREDLDGGGTCAKDDVVVADGGYGCW